MYNQSSKDNTIINFQFGVLLAKKNNTKVIFGSKCFEIFELFYSVYQEVDKQIQNHQCFAELNFNFDFNTHPPNNQQKNYDDFELVYAPRDISTTVEILSLS